MNCRAPIEAAARAEEPLWLVIQTTAGYMLECGELEPGANLRTAIVSRLAQLRGGGWEAENEIGQCPSLSIRRENECLQLMVAVGSRELRLYDQRNLADGCAQAAPNCSSIA
jgi:hypothetical protein